jgi:hypothetical protein
MTDQPGVDGAEPFITLFVTSTPPLATEFILTTKPRPNGLRYPLVDGTRQRYFAGTHVKPRRQLENAQTLTSRVHAALGIARTVRLDGE